MKVTRKIFRAGKCVVIIFSIYLVSWLAWWSPAVDRREVHVQQGPGSTMKTIVAYSEGKRAEMDRPMPVSCDHLPAFPHVPTINRTWSYPEPPQDTQAWQTVPGTDVALYAAYYDPRSSRPHVRILATFRGRKWGDRPPLFCQTRSKIPSETNVEVVAANILEIWRDEWDKSTGDIDTPLLLSCSLTEELTEMSIISVVQQPCYDPQNAFVINPFNYNNEYERNFTVCVKDMKFDDRKTQSLIEWIEVNKILGAEMIDIYVDEIGEQLRRVLGHYRDRGTVRLFHVPVKQDKRSLWQRRRDHIISYNDCLYRNIRESKFILPIDVDEVVLPKIADNWEDLIIRFQALDWDPGLHSSVMVKNVFFFEFIQEDFENGNTNTSRLYTKRDDVRLDIANDVYSENSYSISHTNSVIDSRESEKEMKEYRDMYRNRCKIEMPVSMILTHKVRSSLVSPVGEFSKSIMLTRRVLTAFNHYPLDSIGDDVFGGWPAPFQEVQMNHYKTECNTSLVPDCGVYSVRRLHDHAALRLRSSLLPALAAASCLTTPTANTDKHIQETINK